MNSIKVAQKLIDENERCIESYCSYESSIRECIEELEKNIEKQKKALETLQDSLAREQQELEKVQGEKFEYLVDNLALEAFVANDGGPDMVVD